MNILISGASSEIALKVVSETKDFNFYGLSRSNSEHKDIYKNFWKIKNYTSDELKKTFDQIDNGFFDGLIIFNGTQSPSLLSNFRESQFDELLDINFKIPIKLTNQMLKSKIISNNFNVCFLGSIASKVNDIGNAYYAISKNILAHSTKILAKELKNKSIRINCLNVGLVETKMSENIFKKIPKEGQKELLSRQNNRYVAISDISSTLLTIMKNKAINGQEINLDNGYSL